MQENKIPGINMDAGLNLYEGEMDTYIIVLKSFVTNTPAVLEKLRVVTPESLPDYIINVHGLKTMGAMVGAGDINIKAQKLEALSKAGDLAGVLEINSGLVAETEALIVNIKNWLSAQGE